MGTTSSKNMQLEKLLGNNFPDNIHLVGFENTSNICYANSVLQAFYYCNSFRENIVNYKNIDNIPEKSNPILLLQDLFRKIDNF